MADRGDRMSDGSDERFGRRVHEGLDGGTSRRGRKGGSMPSDEGMGEGERDAGHGGEFGATDTGTDDDPATSGGGAGGSGGYGASSGFAGGTRGADEDSDSSNRRTGGAELEPGATEARTRPGNVGRQAESGMETRPEEGSTSNSGELPDPDGRERGSRRD